MNSTTSEKLARDQQPKVTDETEGHATLTPVDWGRVEKLRVTRKIVEALGNLEVPGLYLIPANRRKDARKKYLGYGSRKMIVEAEVPFVLQDSFALIKYVRKHPEAWQSYRESYAEIVEQALAQHEPVTREDQFGFVHMAVAVWMGQEVVGVLRCGGVIPGKADDLTLVKVTDRVAFLDKGKKDLERDVKKIPFFSSEKMAVVQNLLSMLAQEIGSFLEELARSSELVSTLSQYNHDGFITRNPMILEIIRQINLIGSSESSVIIYGESGTGKELIAKLIHKNSKRADKPFVTINCAALTETILEAELFGYKKGAFTGAIADKRGLFEVADTGIVFLDEVGEMSLALQVKILRLIQEGTFMRVGDTQSRHVDVQVISATHRDLRHMIELGKFREDLYYRLAVVELTLPPLRDRPEDVSVLANQFLQEFQNKTGKSGITLSAEAMKVFQEYYWPGNVREFRNEIERLVALRSDHSVVKSKDLSKKFFYETYPEGMSAGDEDEEGFIKRLVDEFERNLLSKYLRKHKWNKTKVARLCGITRQGLNKKIIKYRLDRRRM